MIATDDKTAYVRAAIEEHVPPELYADLNVWVTEKRQQAVEREKNEAEMRSKGQRVELADALAAVSGSLNGFAAELDQHDLEKLIGDVWCPVKSVGRAFADFLAETPTETDWLIPGLIGRGWCVKFAGREKGGKGTLITYLLGAMERTEDTVFGEATHATALIHTEEPQDSMREKLTDARLCQGSLIFGYELVGLSWLEKVNRLVAEALERNHALLFVDNISRAAGVDDESGTELARRAEELFDAAKAAGLTTIIDHHHRKAGGRIEDKSRGGTALGGATDNNVEIEKSGDYLTRYRRVSSFGRTSETIWQKTIVLSEDRRSYALVADDDQPQSAEQRHRLEALRENPLVTVSEFAALIDASDDTARRVLDEFVEAGHATKSDKRPHRYSGTAPAI